jgi:hypothetical protein
MQFELTKFDVQLGSIRNPQRRSSILARGSFEGRSVSGCWLLNVVRALKSQESRTWSSRVNTQSRH